MCVVWFVVLVCLLLGLADVCVQGIRGGRPKSFDRRAVEAFGLQTVEPFEVLCRREAGPGRMGGNRL